MHNRRLFWLLFLVLQISAGDVHALPVREPIRFHGSWQDDEKASLQHAWRILPRDVVFGRNLIVEKSDDVLFYFRNFVVFSNTIAIDELPHDYSSRAAYLQAVRRSFIRAIFALYDNDYGISRKKEWRAISGWHEERSLEFLIPDWFEAADNQDPRAYAARYGLRSAHDDFVSYASYYFDDFPVNTGEQTLECRTPRKYQFFVSLFPESRSQSRVRSDPCESIDRGFLSGIEFLHPITREPLDLGPINADTVKGFELLYATPGVGEMAEVAGHLLLRIKLDNNPEADRLAIENPYDLVVSFLADTGDQSPAAIRSGESKCSTDGDEGSRKILKPDFNPMAAAIQAIKGLSGGFLTTFDRNTLFSTVYNYTVLEDRNLLRYELKVSDEEKRELLDHLYEVVRNYRSRYYFFDRNCASILVQTVSEGLKRSDLSAFRPVVAPPNSLVALYRREDLVRPVFPSFYSFRKEAQISQKMIESELERIRGALSPDKRELIPSTSEMFSKSDGDRVLAWKSLQSLVENEPQTSASMIKIARLQQVSEKLYVDREQSCSSFTSQLSVDSRNFILAKNSDVPAQRLDHSLQIANRPSEQAVASTGSNHTGLLSVETHVVHQRGGAGLGLGLSLHHQDMGDISAHAMQRTSQVTLGHLSLSLPIQSRTTISTWQATALTVRKFRDELEQAPTVFSPARTFGVGFDLLDYERQEEKSLLTWGGGKLLFSLATGHLNDRHLYAALGLSAKSFRRTDGDLLSLAFPISPNGLWTFDQLRSVQLRGTCEWEPFVSRGGGGSNYQVSANIRYRLSIDSDYDYLLFLSGRRTSFFGNQIVLGIEVNRW